MTALALGSWEVQVGFEDAAVVEQCPIQCATESSVCLLGNRVPSPVDALWQPPVTARSFAAITSDHSYYCLCKSGFTGEDCSVQMESCPFQNSNTDDLAVCLHGGTCREGGGCDCTTAVHNGTKFAGPHCELEVPTEAYCSDASVEQSEGKRFCLNGGTCSAFPDTRCTCPDGFEGEHCEMKKSNPSIASECNLSCRNQGVCVIGPSKNPDVPFRHEAELEGMHCRCSDGYAGALCQYQVQNCGDNGLICLHGSQCVKSAPNATRAGEGTSRPLCACQDPDDPVCNKHVEYCTPEAGHVEYFESMAAPAFCVNGGRCEDVANGPLVQYRCICPELFHGKHCELLKNGRDILNEVRAAEAAAAWQASQEALDFRRRGFISLYILLAALAVTTVAWYLRLRWRVRRSARRNNTNYFNKNLYRFRDENVGVTTANGNMMFPTFYVTGSGNRFEEDEQHLILHDVELT